MTGTRLVLDTNVLLSALLFSTGSFSWLRRAWQSEAILPLASRDTTAELIRVLRYPKFRLTREELWPIICLGAKRSSCQIRQTCRIAAVSIRLCINAISYAISNRIVTSPSLSFGSTAIHRRMNFSSSARI